MSEGVDRIVTIQDLSSTLVNTLFKQFARYLEESEKNQSLFEERKKAIPDFSQYSSDPTKYHADFKAKNALTATTEDNFLA